MKTIIALSIILLVSSVFGDVDVCVEGKKREGMENCTNFDNLTSVIQNQFILSDLIYLEWRPKINLTIIPYTFNNSYARFLMMRVYKADYGRKIPEYSWSLVQDSFAGMSHLLVLWLRHVNFNSDVNPLVPLGSLKELGITAGRLTEVPTQMWASVRKLGSLKLSENQISVISSNSFAPLKNLQLLDLSYNGITHIESGAFNGLSQLTLLQLKGNPISDVPIGPFDNLTSLEYLGLSGCTILRIIPGTFSQLIVEELDLRFNGIDIIETETFKNLSVKTLNLGGNFIMDLEPRAFSGLITEELNLESNLLMEIDFDDFEGLNTSSLLLSNNMINTIAPCAFKNVVTRVLEIYNNELSSLGRVDLGLPNSVEIVL